MCVLVIFAVIPILAVILMVSCKTPSGGSFLTSSAGTLQGPYTLKVRSPSGKTCLKFTQNKSQLPHTSSCELERPSETFFLHSYQVLTADKLWRSRSTATPAQYYYFEGLLELRDESQVNSEQSSEQGSDGDGTRSQSNIDRITDTVAKGPPTYLQLRGGSGTLDGKVIKTCTTEWLRSMMSTGSKRVPWIWGEHIELKIDENSGYLSPNPQSIPFEKGFWARLWKKIISIRDIVPNGKHVLTSKYGFRWGRMHKGIDIACETCDRKNRTVIAAGSGIVERRFDEGGYGCYLLIWHKDRPIGNTGRVVETLYAHLNPPLVETGEYVTLGQPIGIMGGKPNSNEPCDGRTTGRHLHFETYTRRHDKGHENPQKHGFFTGGTTALVQIFGGKYQVASTASASETEDFFRRLGFDPNVLGLTKPSNVEIVEGTGPIPTVEVNLHGNE